MLLTSKPINEEIMYRLLITNTQKKNNKNNIIMLHNATINLL